MKVDDSSLIAAFEEHRAMGLGLPGVKQVLDVYALQPWLEHFTYFNRAAGAPYHNDYHSFCMVLNCAEGAIHEGLTASATRALVIAALYHDFDHTAGRADDGVNIERALIGLELGQRYTFSRQQGLTGEELKVARSAIQITKYPYEGAPSSMPEKIIRDADLMQLYENDDSALRDQFLGLKEELELQRGVLYSRPEFAEGCEKFYNQVVWYTDWAKDKASYLRWNERKQHLVTLLKDETA